MPLFEAALSCTCRALAMNWELHTGTHPPIGIGMMTTILKILSRGS
jgi:hypothetical protein